MCKNDNPLRDNNGRNKYVKIAHGKKPFCKTEN